MTRLCGNCFWFTVLPSCSKNQKAKDRACGEWSPNAEKILKHLQDERQDKMTIALMIDYISQKCSRCPAYRPREKCAIEDCEGYLREYFAGKVETQSGRVAR